MKQFLTRTMLALGVAATVMTGAISPTTAAPLAANSAAVKEAAPINDVTQVHRRYYRNWGGAVLGLGALALAYEAGRRHHRGHYYRGYQPYYYGGGGGRWVYNERYGRYVLDCNHRGRRVC